MVAVQQAEGCATEQSQIGDQVGFPAAGIILAPERISAPMIAVFDSGPVTTDERNPRFKRAFVGLLAGEIITEFKSALARALERPPTLDPDDGSGEGEVDGRRFNRL